MQIGETRKLKKVVGGVRVLPEVQPPECCCGWQNDNGDSVTFTLDGGCKLHKPTPQAVPVIVQKQFA